MNNDKTKQLAESQQIMLPGNHDLLQTQNPLDLVTEQVRRFSELPIEFTQTHTFSVEAEDRAFFIDLVKGSIEAKPCSISAKIEPCKQ